MDERRKAKLQAVGIVGGMALLAVALVLLMAPSGWTQAVFPNGAIVTVADNLGLAQAQKTAAVLMGYDGTNADMARVNTAADNDVLTTQLRTAAIQMAYDGATVDLVRQANVFKVLASTDVSAAAVVWTPASTKQAKIMGYYLVGDTAGNYVIERGSSGADLALYRAQTAVGDGVHVFLNGAVILSGAADATITIDGPASSTISGIIYGVEE